MMISSTAAAAADRFHHGRPESLFAHDAPDV